ncbi:GL18791 [Drosophila persimilis]|uniref:GL18791 n=1 Tax=Drosophila persimilis TaxID=7234 RepID=B4G8P7_DROPE|nr:GL18791 [Drosophila persimilis]
MRFHFLIVLFALLAVVAAQGRLQRPQGGSRGRPQFGNDTLSYNSTAATTTEASSTSTEAASS